ncbi:ComF family protein [Streptosporangiaceae bacterium NEAU-GS5]|nr:ComF family protein [Streptosporangiaceae bacterium NEAU-GS5]
MLTPLLDLILPPRCAGCDAPGSVVCPVCAARVRGVPARRLPEPSPPGMPPCWSAGDYDGVTRRLLLACKERGRTAVAPVLAEALAGALAATVTAVGAAVEVVPIPSTRAAYRIRGHDPVRRMATLAVRGLRAEGAPVTLVPLLTQRRRVADQAGLSATQRAANLEEAYLVVSRSVRPARASSAPAVVLVDDIVTTGATLAEAARALRVAGHEVRAAATVAATRRRGGSEARKGLRSV